MSQVQVIPGDTVVQVVSTRSVPQVGVPMIVSHSELLNRDAADSHPIAAVTDLQDTLDGLQSQIDDVSTEDHNTLSNRDAADAHPIAAVTGLQAALDGKQASNANLTAFAALTGAANLVPYFTGVGAMATSALTTFGLSLIACVNGAAGLTVLGAEAAGAAAAAISAHVALPDPHAQYRLESANVPWSEISSTPTTLAGYGIADAQPLDTDLTAIAALISAADKIAYATGAGTWALADFSSAGRALVDDVDAAAQRTTLGLGTVATLAFDTDITLAANSDSRIATQKATKAYIDGVVTGLLDFKGSTDCSANPNYPAALKGDSYVVSVAGKIGGASGVNVAIGDVYFATADNAGGTQASVGTSWTVLEHNIPDLATVATTGSASDLATGTLPDARLSNTITAGGPTGSASVVPIITWDAHGRLTAVSSASIAIAAGAVSGLATVATSGSASDLGTGTLASARGGTGVSNAGTLTNAANTTITGGGTIALGSFTLTVPATDTAALLGQAQTFTAAQIINVNGGTSTNPITGYGLWVIGGGSIRSERYVGGTGFAAYIAEGTIAAPSAPILGRQFINIAALGWTAAATWIAQANYIIGSTEAWPTNRGMQHTWQGTLTGSATKTDWMVLQGTTGTDPFGTLGIGATPTAGNGLLQLAGGGTTKAYGLAFSTDCFIYKSAATSITIDASTMLTLTGGLTFADAKDITFNTSTGTKIGTGTTQKIGFWNKAPVAQQSATTTAPTAVVTTGSALASYGYTQAQADDIVTQLNRNTARLNDIATKIQTIGLIA